MDSFLIGSSYFVLAPHVLRLLSLNPKHVKFSMNQYILIAPIYLGLLNVVSEFVTPNSITLENRLLYTGITSGIFVFLLNFFLQNYVRTSFGWLFYFITIVLHHIIDQRFIVYFLEKNKTNMYLKSFLTGSSFLVTLPHFIALILTDPKRFNFSLNFYFLTAPLYFGFANIISSSLIQDPTNELANQTRLLYTGIISGLLIFSTVFLFNLYPNKQLAFYFIIIILHHIFDFRFVIYNLEKYFNSFI